MVTDSRGPAEKAIGLRRVIGPSLLLFFVIGDILGTGIYALIGSVAARIGGALWLPFLMAFLVALLTALSYLELVGKYPRAAGAALYTQLAFGVRFLTFMVAFAVMASGVTSAASAATAFGETYLAEFLPLPLWLVGFVFLLGLGLVNFRGVGESVRANVVLTTVELSGLLIVIAVGSWAVAHGHGEPARLVQFSSTGSGGWTAITAATSLAWAVRSAAKAVRRSPSVGRSAMTCSGR
jgi:amino acid transporter